MSKRLVIGLTGGIGSGKSAVSQILMGLNAYIIDADKISREVTAEGTECNGEIKNAFKDCVEDGVLNRGLLKKAIFKSKYKRRLLNFITHPYILKEVKRLIKPEGVTVIEVPLLFESGFNTLCDYTVCVIAPKKTRIERVNKRDNMPAYLIKAIMRAQVNQKKLVKLCDYAIDNGDGFDLLKRRVAEWWEKVIIGKNS